MKWRIVTTGKPSFGWVREGKAEYEKRMQRFAGVTEVALKARAGVEAYQRASEGCFRLALDERGERVSTMALYERVMGWELAGMKEVAVWIGGADGFSEPVGEAADWVVSLGAMTLMHELALLVWLEQLYRVYTLKANLPYHRS